MASREGLRVIFHLVDSRHGPLDQDLATMEAMEVSVLGLRQGREVTCFCSWQSRCFVSADLSPLGVGDDEMIVFAIMSHFFGNAYLMIHPKEPADRCVCPDVSGLMWIGVGGSQGLREGVRYVVVLTKADKKDGKISPTVMQVCRMM